MEYYGLLRDLLDGVEDGLDVAIVQVGLLVVERDDAVQRALVAEIARVDIYQVGKLNARLIWQHCARTLVLDSEVARVELLEVHRCSLVHRDDTLIHVVIQWDLADVVSFKRDQVGVVLQVLKIYLLALG